MTQKEIQQLQLSLSAEGFALCKQGKTGTMLPVRRITDQEITTMLSMMYARHITEHPEEKIMLLPMDDKGNALAVTFAQVDTPKQS